jgi:pyruvate,water dikinase
MTTNDTGSKKTIGNRLKSVMGVLRRGVQRPEAPQERTEKFRLMYGRFREILNLNDSILQLIAEIEDKLSGRLPFAMDPVVQKVRKAALDVVMMVKNLNQLAEGRYRKLYDTLGRLNSEIEGEYASQREASRGPVVFPLTDLRVSDSALAGTKMANLGEVKSLGLNVPDGFVITTAAFAKLMTRNELWESAVKLEGIAETYGPLALDNACRQVQGAIQSSPVPPDVEKAIYDAFDAMAGGQDILVALRSSAVGEDKAASHAGQYYSELNVVREVLLDAYRMVLASSYRPNAVVYRYERGLTLGEATMAVGCMRMVKPRCSGIMFSRDFKDLDADRMAISVTSGLAAGIVSGKQGAEEIVMALGDHPQAPQSSYLDAHELEMLAHAARRLEKHFGSPQDSEWALDTTGRLFILQTRPMAIARPVEYTVPEIVVDQEPLLAGGYVANAGVGAGPVFHVKTDNDLERFPDGSVLVARHSSPTFSRIMTRCKAIVTDVGSPTGHMAILAREFGIPAIVGMDNATRVLDSGRVVTVDATSCRVFDGDISPAMSMHAARPPLADTPVVKHLRRIAHLVTPLHLTDPASPDFTPDGCQSLHDITRFVHEKVYEVMFRFGDMAARDRQHSFKLDADLPLDIRVFDVGEAIVEGASNSGLLKPHDIISAPMRAFMEGLLDKRIRWDQPRPISARGFLSVLGESMAGPPAEAQKVGSVSYVVASDRYMNFSTKAGYHFSTVDVYCGESQNKNYIHFRFAGGGAAVDRRSRRVQFLSEVLNSLDFKVQAREDLLIARLEKYDHTFICSRLTDLGRLTMCSRQLDMLMDTDASPQFFAQAFLEGEMERF